MKPFILGTEIKLMAEDSVEGFNLGSFFNEAKALGMEVTVATEGKVVVTIHPKLKPGPRKKQKEVEQEQPPFESKAGNAGSEPSATDPVA